MYPDQDEDYSRPLLIISNEILHQNTDFFISVGITTSVDSHPSQKIIQNATKSISVIITLA